VSGPTDQQRIKDLEDELARLRADAEPPVSGAQELTPDDMKAAGQSRSRVLKMILLATALICIALAIFLGVFSALSKGFSALADKAARSFPAQELVGDKPAPDQWSPPSTPSDTPPP